MNPFSKAYTIFWLILLLPGLSIAQEMDEKEERNNLVFLIGTNYTVVHQTWTGALNTAVGVQGTMVFPLLKKSGLNGQAQFGVNRIVDCGVNCASEWFLAPVWAGLGLQKELELSPDHVFVGSLGMKKFFGAKQDELMQSRSELGTERHWLLGFGVGYYLPVHQSLLLSYNFDGEQYYRLHSVSLAWRIN